MMHSDFIEDDERFSDRETTDREMHLELKNEEYQNLRLKINEMNKRVANANNSLDIYESLKL